MSISLMTEAWKSDMASGCKLVLLSLCDNANDQGECFPSVSMIAKRCSMGERTVQAHIASMEAGGILKRLERNGRSNIYTIDPRRFCTPADSAPPRKLHPTPADFAPTPPQISHPTPADFAPITIKEPSIEPKGKQKKGAAMLCPADVDQQVWDDWMVVRKAKKAGDLTATAFDAVRRESAKAGWTVCDALRECCARSWVGFKAVWVAERQAAGRSDALSFAQQDAAEKRRRWEEMTGRKWPEADRLPDVIDITPSQKNETLLVEQQGL